LIAVKYQGSPGTVNENVFVLEPTYGEPAKLIGNSSKHGRKGLKTDTTAEDEERQPGETEMKEQEKIV